ncbi:hypothetical protein RR48_08428 [Papilio machaon]|uniref:Uncharacterized protein n=1 Tax=Papilio machaon TaxID=76193 RepID=A0A194QR17_PAPMA|nr:hypothetical protein RR48_08428 [Papilio machaon]
MPTRSLINFLEQLSQLTTGLTRDGKVFGRALTAGGKSPIIMAIGRRCLHLAADGPAETPRARTLCVADTYHFS